MNFILHIPSSRSKRHPLALEETFIAALSNIKSTTDELLYLYQLRDTSNLLVRTDTSIDSHRSFNASK